MTTIATRRKFIAGLGGAGAAALVGAAALGRAYAGSSAEEDEASPLEDLMREHAVLERLMLVYDEASRRLDSGADLSPDVTARASRIIHEYIEDHHERDEEEFIFPKMVAAKREVELVRVLLSQHEAGRRVTAEIQALSTAATLRDADARKRLADSMRSFVRMYRPHASHENTVLFPAFHRVMPEGEYERLQELLEKKERAKYGDGLYDRVLAEVGSIERDAGIGTLASYTPTR